MRFLGSTRSDRSRCWALCGAGVVAHVFLTNINKFKAAKEVDAGGRHYLSKAVKNIASVSTAFAASVESSPPREDHLVDHPSSSSSSSQEEWCAISRANGNLTWSSYGVQATMVHLISKTMCELPMGAMVGPSKPQSVAQPGPPSQIVIYKTARSGSTW